MHIATQAIVCAVLAHGEHGAVARLLTPADGLQPGYVRGGRSRRLRPVLIPGNIVAADLRARSETQLAALTVELVQSRAGLFAEPLAAAAIEWACALTAATLPEGHPYPRLHSALDALLVAIESAARATQWAPALIGYERLLIAELGYGVEYRASGDDWLVALRENGELLAGDLLPNRAMRVLASRERLVERLKRLG